MGIHDHLIVPMASAGLVAAGVIGWFLNSSLLGVVTGVLLGALVSAIVQSRTRKQAWKRELSQSNTGTIYAPLFREVNSIISAVVAFNPVSGLRSLPHETWDAIRFDYLYYFVSKPVRESLENLYLRVSRFDALWLEIQSTVLELVHREASQFFKSDVIQIEHYLDYITDSHIGASHYVPLLNCLIFDKHPRDLLLNAYSDLQLPKFRVSYFERLAGRDSTVHLETPEGLQSFDDLWRLISNKAPRGRIAEMWRVVADIKSKAPNLRESILRQIREPWSV